MADKIGPRFVEELQAAGLTGLAFSWTNQALGDLSALTPQQRDTLNTVLAAHDPTLPATKQARADAISTDADAVDLLNRLRTATATQIKSYVNTNSAADAGTKLLLSKILLALALLNSR